jgi:hypothetical protein
MVRTGVGHFWVPASGKSVRYAGEDLDLILGFILRQDVFCAAAEFGAEGKVRFWDGTRKGTSMLILEMVRGCRLTCTRH